MKGRVLAPLVETPKRDNLNVQEMQPLQQCSWLAAGVIGFLVGFNYYSKESMKSEMVQIKHILGDLAEKITSNEPVVCNKLSNDELMCQTFERMVNNGY